MGVLKFWWIGFNSSPQSIKFEHFKIQAGSDSTGVATDMITMNSTVKMIYRNTGTFFGVHVTSTPIDLSYSQINIASGTVSPTSINSWTLKHSHFIKILKIWCFLWCWFQMKRFYQSRKSQRSVTIAVMGNKIPLYGSGASLSSSTGTTALPVSLKLNFVVRSRAYVLGKLVKPRFYKKIECDVTFDPKKLNVPISLKKSCTYDWWIEQITCETRLRVFFFFSLFFSLFFCWRWVGYEWVTAKRAGMETTGAGSEEHGLCTCRGCPLAQRNTYVGFGGECWHVWMITFLLFFLYYHYILLKLYKSFF